MIRIEAAECRFFSSEEGLECLVVLLMLRYDLRGFLLGSAAISGRLASSTQGPPIAA